MRHQKDKDCKEGDCARGKSGVRIEGLKDHRMEVGLGGRGREKKYGLQRDGESGGQGSR